MQDTTHKDDANITELNNYKQKDERAGTAGSFYFPRRSLDRMGGRWVIYKCADHYGLNPVARVVLLWSGRSCDVSLD